MTLILREDDVRQVLTMPDTIDALEAALRDFATERAQNVPRQRIILREQQGTLHLLPATVPSADALGFKSYTTFPGGVRFSVTLYSASTGELLALIAADWLGRMRTGAASGVATKYLARQDASILGMIGAGGQAETQLLAMAAVRPFTSARIWGRDPQRLAGFIARMAPQVPFPLEAAPSAADAVRGADVVVTITSAREPVLFGDWLASGAHVNAAGSNWHHRREVDDETVQRAGIIVADSVEQAHREAGDLIIPASTGKLEWNRVGELADVVAGRAPGRRDETTITLFKSLGIGLEDLAVAARVFTLARERGLGETVQMF